MNTLPKAITAQIIADISTYQSIRSHWSDLMRSTRRHELRTSHHLLYLALLGKDWRKAFRCLSNSNKLNNGAFPGWGLFRATAVLHMVACEEEVLAPFDGLVTPAMLQQIRQLIPVPNAYKLQPEQFAAGEFPFEAYVVPA